MIILFFILIMGCGLQKNFNEINKNSGIKFIPKSISIFTNELSVIQKTAVDFWNHYDEKYRLRQGVNHKLGTKQAQIKIIEAKIDKDQSVLVSPISRDISSSEKGEEKNAISVLTNEFLSYLKSYPNLYFYAYRYNVLDIAAVSSQHYLLEQVLTFLIEQAIQDYHSLNSSNNFVHYLAATNGLHCLNKLEESDKANLKNIVEKLAQERNKEGLTPLMIAYYYGNKEFANHLIGNYYKEESDILQIKDNYDFTVGDYAAMGGVILDNEDWKKSSYTAFFAAASGHQSILKQIDSIKNVDGERTLLMEASLRGFPDVVAFLVEREESVLTQDENGLTALMLACSKRNKDCIEVLLSQNKTEQMNKLDNENLGPLSHLVDYEVDKQEEIMELLLQDVDINQIDAQNASVKALKLRNGNVAQRLMKAGMDPNFSVEGRYFIELVVEQVMTGTLLAMINKNVDLKPLDDNGIVKPLINGLDNDSFYMSKILFSEGAYMSYGSDRKISIEDLISDNKLKSEFLKKMCHLCKDGQTLELQLVLDVLEEKKIEVDINMQEKIDESSEDSYMLRSATEGLNFKNIVFLYQKKGANINKKDTSLLEEAMSVQDEEHFKAVGLLIDFGYEKTEKVCSWLNETATKVFVIGH